MATLNIPYSFTNGTTANATEVNSNFSSVKTFVEGSLVQADGSVKAGLSALATEVVNLLVPAGTISPFVGAAAPTGWLLCDGATVTGGQTLYPNLWAVLPAAYKSGSNIVLPNLKGRTIVGYDSAQTEFDVVGETGGVKTVTLTAAQSGLPSHSHGITDPGHFHGVGYKLSYFDGVTLANEPDGTSPSTYATSTATTGISVNSVSAANASEAHTNLQPYIVFNYIIKA